ncbi:hypothetical protein LR48_Vigan11g142900 [Vigna angularis]|uniref:TIR domain-containing protein n=1 Tax=Phaseolus angularis TaxID=3914 RepID=A0A0L9VTJ3_PHAAN|nr:hypothetical protein LR48_Vigan11g142900 [Vigna angularis]
MDNASSSNKVPRKYDVLINFTGEDINRKFVSHLNYALSTVGLTTFLHYNNAVKSTHIQEPILSHCRVAIVVFTQTYSQSVWCLHQLQQIINWHHTYCRHVLPVYYEIQPSDVRLQKGYFGKALKATAQQTFSGEELEDGMSRWCHALTKAANFFGWDESNHRSDAELVDKIVNSVVNLPVLSATKFPVLRSLKVLNLSHSEHLTTTPDFTGLPSLEHLIFKYCSRLRKLHQSIGSLNSLTLLNLKYCTSLNNLPTKIYDLKSLRTFILSGCSIHIMDKDIAKLESLITLIAENTAVRHVPFSIVSSKGIGYMSLRRFEGLSNNLFPSIIRSWMSPTMNPISYIHSFCMDMEDNTIDIAPLLSTLAHIRSVLVACDTELQLSKQVTNILVEYFANITESGISKQHFRCSLIGVGAYHQFFNAVSNNIYEVLASSESGDVCLPTVNDSYCLAHMGEGQSVSFTVPQDRDMKGMILCVVYLSTPKIIEPEFTVVLIVNYTKCTFQIHNHGTVISFKDEDWHGIMSNLESGDNVGIFVNFDNGLMVKNTTVYLICSESKNMEKASESKKHSLIRFIKKVVM